MEQRDLTDAEMRRQIEILIEHMSDEEVRRAYRMLTPPPTYEHCSAVARSGGYPCVKRKGHTDRHQNELGGWWINTNPEAEPDCTACGGDLQSRTTMLATHPPRPAPCERCCPTPAEKLNDPLGIRNRKPEPRPLHPELASLIGIATSVNQHLAERNTKLHHVIVEAYSMINRTAVDYGTRVHNTSEILRHEATATDRLMERLRSEATA